MKNILIITAHPSEKNLTQGIADIVVTQKEAQGHKVELVDLYKDKQLPYLNYATNSEMANLSDEQKYYQEKVTWADDIVIVYPFWWGTTPAILKNWIDSVLTMGFAAKYGDNGRPIGLLQGKSVRIISTSGAPTFWYCINGIRRANKKIWKQTIVEFCGMKFQGYHLFGGMDTKAKNVDKMFKCVTKIANK
jgi:NAD(P)H dehydrogenase (quinone)